MDRVETWDPHEVNAGLPPFPMRKRFSEEQERSTMAKALFTILLAVFVSSCQKGHEARVSITLNGVLQDSAPVEDAAAIPVVPSAAAALPEESPTFADLDLVAAYSKAVSLKDASGNMRTLYFYFFHTAPSTIEMRVYAKSDDINGPGEKPVGIADASGTAKAIFLFDEAGKRKNALSGADLTLNVPWKDMAGVADSIDIRVLPAFDSVSNLEETVTIRQ